MGLFSSLFVLTLVRDLGLARGRRRRCAGAGRSRRRRWSRSSARAVVPLLAVLVTLWGFVNARRTAAVVRVDVPIAGLPPALHGFTIAQISDIHVGPTIKRAYVEAIVDAVNGLDADMVAITGDLVDGSVRDLARARRAARRPALAPRHASSSPATTSTTRAPRPGCAELRRLGLQRADERARRRCGAATRRWCVAGVTDFSAAPLRPGPAQRSAARRSPARRARGAAAAARAPAAQRRGGRGRRLRPAALRATPTAASSCRGTSSSACSSRSPPGCTAGAGCGSTPAAAPATGGRRSASARRRRSPCCGWSPRPPPAPARVPARPRGRPRRPAGLSRRRRLYNPQVLPAPSLARREDPPVFISEAFAQAAPRRRRRLACSAASAACCRWC